MPDNNRMQSLLFAMSERNATSQSEAETILEPYAPTIVKCITDAFQEFDDVPDQTRAKTYPGTRGHVITNLAWEHVRDGLTGSGGLEFCDELGFFKVIIEDRLVVRFKRLNKNLLAISQKSDQAVTWFGNKPLRKIPSHLLRLNFGYQPSWDWKTCTEFYLTHQASFEHLEWASSIPNYAEAFKNPGEKSGSSDHGLPPVKIVPLARPAREFSEDRELA